jgi:hypothetical protein
MIKAMYTLQVDQPSLAAKKHMKTAVAVAYSDRRQVWQSDAQGMLWVFAALITYGRSSMPQSSTGSPLTDLVADSQKLIQITFLGRL